ncbi:MAG: glycosyltransferase family 4 protein [Bacteroidia bacterium]
MRIALLTDGIFPYAVGGMQKNSFHVARQLARNKHTVYLFHCNESSYDASRLEFFTDEEKKYIRPFLIPFPHKRYFPLHYIVESRLYSEAIYNALTPLLPETDFIIAKGFCAWELLKHKQRNTPPIAVHFHGMEMFQHIPSFKTTLSSYFLRPIVIQNLRQADYAISYGGKITEIFRRLLPPEKIWEVPGCVESGWLTDAVKPAGDTVKFIFLGRYERRKGIQELNKALKLLLADNNFSFNFIGDIPDKFKITSPLLHYYGKLTNEQEIKKLLSNNDVLVSPSFAEGMPVAIMEAMAQGLSIIATDAGSVSTLVDGSNGWLLPYPSPGLIEMAMRNAIKEKNNLQAKKESSVKKIKDNFLVESSANMLIELMQQHIKT